MTGDQLVTIDKVESKTSSKNQPYEVLTVGKDRYFVWDEKLLGKAHAGAQMALSYVDKNNYKTVNKLLLRGLPDAPTQPEQAIAREPSKSFEETAPIEAARYALLAARMAEEFAKIKLTLTNDAFCRAVSTVYIQLKRGEY